MIPKNENLLKYVKKITSFTTFCILLDMEYAECDKIKQQEKLIDDQKLAALAKWQSTGERTFKDLFKVIALIGDHCADAKRFASEHNVYFDEEDVLNSCPNINNNLYH